MSLDIASYSGPLSGCDTDTQITSAAEAQCLFDNTPYIFIFRCISNYASEQPGDLSHKELLNLTEAGWLVGVVQHALAPGAPVTRSLGTTMGDRAVANAKSVGVPEDAWLWLDMEDYNTQDSKPFDFCQSWADAVKAGHDVPTLYYGAPGLAASQVKGLVSSGDFKTSWAGCGQTQGIGESINQGPCDVQTSVTCSGTTYTLGIDEDTLLSGKSATFIYNN